MYMGTKEKIYEHIIKIQISWYGKTLDPEGKRDQHSLHTSTKPDINRQKPVIYYYLHIFAIILSLFCKVITLFEMLASFQYKTLLGGSK